MKKGDLLFRIEQATYKALVDQQLAAVAKAKAIEANAVLQLDRGRELGRSLNIPQSTIDQRAADAGTAKADVMVAQAALEQAKINFDYTEIHSPIDGRIGLANFTVGNLVGPTSGSLATIVSHDPIYVIFQASERDIIAYKRRVAAEGGPHVVVRLKLPDGSMYPPPGLSNFLDIQVANTTDTVAVRAQFPNPDGLLIPGGVVGVTVERGAPKSTLGGSAGRGPGRSGRPLRPSRRRRQEGRAAADHHRGRAGHRHRRHVGAQAGRAVIIEGIQKVRPGQVVSAAPPPGR